MTESLFYKCNSCGKIVDWFHYGSLCEECGQNTFSPLKELYVVCSEREKDVLSDAFNVLHINSYEISVLPIHNDCNLYGDNLIFPTISTNEADVIQALKRRNGRYSTAELQSIVEFFSAGFSQYDRIVVCHAGDIRGKLHKYALSYRFEKESKPLYEMDLSYASEIMVKSGYAVDYKPIGLHGMFSYVIAASNPAVRVSMVDKSSCALLWRELLQSQTGLCICEGSAVINVPLSYYDECLIEAASSIADTDMDDLLSDSEKTAILVDIKYPEVGFRFLRKRVMKLVSDGKIDFLKLRGIHSGRQ